MQIAGIISAVIVLIVILAIGFLLAPLQKVFTGFTLRFLLLAKDRAALGVTGSVHRLQWEPNRALQSLVLLPRS